MMNDNNDMTTTLKLMLDDFGDADKEHILLNTVLINYLASAKLNPNGRVAFTLQDFINKATKKAEQNDLKFNFSVFNAQDVQAFLLNNLNELSRVKSFSYKYDSSDYMFYVQA